MFLRSIHQPAVSLKEKDFNNLLETGSTTSPLTLSYAGLFLFKQSSFVPF